MLKYIPEDTSVVFEEIPNEVTLTISLSRCPHGCLGCHSPYLGEDIGDELTFDALYNIIMENSGFTTLCFMGDGGNLPELIVLVRRIKNYYHGKIALYTGATSITEDWAYLVFDYIKIGPYISELGPISSPTTNQRMFAKVTCIDTPVETLYLGGKPRPYWKDITSKFWKR